MKRINYDILLKDIDYVIYWNKNLARLTIADVRDRKSVDYHGYPLYRGYFGNCLIKLDSLYTEKLYLLSISNMQDLISEYNECYNINNNKDMIVRIVLLLLEKYKVLDKLIAELTENTHIVY